MKSHLWSGFKNLGALLGSKIFYFLFQDLATSSCIPSDMGTSWDSLERADNHYCPPIVLYLSDARLKLLTLQLKSKK